jgi:hypothetical protein
MNTIYYRTRDKIENMKTQMMRVLAVLVVSGGTFLAGAGPAICGVTASSLDAPPSKVYIGNAEFRANNSAADGVQARKVNDSDVRSVYQSFTWATDAKLSAVGFMVSPSFSTFVSAPLQYQESQNWTVAIYALKSNSHGGVVSTVKQETFPVKPTDIVPGHYLDMAFSEPVALTQGTTYAINLYPAENKDQRVLFAFSKNKTFLGGSQGPGASTKTVNLQTLPSDLTFYIVTAP